MKKRITIMILSLLLCIGMSMSVFAEEADQTEGFADEYYRLMDIAGVLTEQEATELLEMLDETSERQKFEVVVIFNDSLEGEDIQSYSDEFYEYCNFGYGNNKDGALLLISMEEREWCITTCGYGMTVFTGDAIDYTGEQMHSSLSDGDYAKASKLFIQYTDQFVSQAREGHPFDKSDLPKEPLSAIWILVSLGVGFAIAMFVVATMKGQLKSVFMQSEAGNYVRQGSMNVTESRDVFLYRKVSRTQKPKNDRSDNGAHKSASGTSHGGGSGKF